MKVLTSSEPDLVTALKPTLVEVYRAHAQTVARWARYLGGQEIEVEDVVQDVFMTVGRLLGSFEDRGHGIKPWLYRLTQNAVRHQRRKNRFRRWLGGTSAEVAGELQAPGGDPAEELERRRAQERLHKVLGKMRERYRTVFILAELEGLSGEQIAAMMDTKLSTVWVWLHRARADFASRLERLDREERR